MKRPDSHPYDSLIRSAFTPVHREYPKAVTLPHGLEWTMLPDGLNYADRNPRRIITRSGARVRGGFNHARIGHCQWESSPESCLYPLLALSPSVSRVYSQPLVINLNAGQYTPDALVYLASGNRVWIECKQDCNFDEETRAKLAEAALIFLAAGDRFIVVDATHLHDDHPAVVNARLFTAWYETAADYVPVVKEAQPYAALTSRHGAYTINRAVARGELMMDFNVELSQRSLLWTPKEGESYEPDFLRA